LSAAANAAGFLYFRGLQPGSEPSSLAAPQAAPSHALPDPAKPARTPSIKYRKRRSYALPSAA